MLTKMVWFLVAPSSCSCMSASPQTSIKAETSASDHVLSRLILHTNGFNTHVSLSQLFSSSASGSAVYTQNIAEAILDICENWGLSRDNLVATTTDNGTNFIAGMAQLECTRISCFGYNLDLAINKSLNITRVQRTIGRCPSCSTEAGRREISPKNRVIWELSNTNLYLQVHISLSLSHTHTHSHSHYRYTKYFSHVSSHRMFKLGGDPHMIC